MVLLSVFRPFQQCLAEGSTRPVTTMLKDFFAMPLMLRTAKDNRKSLINTKGVIHRLITAIQQHEVQSRDPGPGSRLVQMLNKYTYEDPSEAWNILHDIVMEEQGASTNIKHIGVHTHERRRCETCKKVQDRQQQHLGSALPLRGLTCVDKPSVQKAIQERFAPYEVEMRCCDGKKNTPHLFLERCIRGDEGMVLCAPFSSYSSLAEFEGIEFDIEDEIRIPFNGPSSGIQSSYELVGFTARLVHKAHHVAIIYDNKGDAWTYDDARVYKGLPQESWVPGLLFYDCFMQQVQDEDVDFEDLPSLCDASQQQPQTEPTDSQEACDHESGATTRGIPTRSGRQSCPTRFYKPGETRNEKSSDIQKPAEKRKGRTQQQQPTQRGKAAQESRTEGNSQSPRDENATDTQTPESLPSTVRNTSSQPQNPLAQQYPKHTWAWVRDKGEFRLAEVWSSCSENSMKIKWAHKQGLYTVNNKRIFRELHIAEQRIVFGMRNDEGRQLSLKKVEALLRSQGGVRRVPTETQIQLSEDHEDSYSGLVFTPATANWDSLAFTWLLKQDSNFDPLELIGRSFSLPSNIPDECFDANHEFPAHPSFCSCFREIALVLQQLQPHTRLYQLLFAWAHLLPILLLRASESCTKKEMVKLITARCTQFLQGEWEMLFTKARKDALKLATRAARLQTRGTSSLALQKRIEQAEKCIRRGNLSKGARILTGDGTSKDPNALSELSAKHPQDVPPASFPQDYVPPPVPEASEDELAKCLSLANLARVATNFPAESHPDQWGWRPREYISRMLHDPSIGNLVQEVFITPRHQGQLPKLYGECYRGGQLLALSKAPKPGSRPIAIGDCFRRLLDKALQPVSKNDLAHMFEHTYGNVKQFASGSKDGAEKYIVSVLLALGKFMALQEEVQCLEDDPMAVMLLDCKNAFNALLRQLVFDMITRDFDGSYAQGRLTKDNVTVLPESFAVHIPAIRAHYEGDGRLVFVDVERLVHYITSRTGMQQGCVLGGKLFNIGTFSVVGATMADHPETFCPMFSDNIALVGRLSKLFPAAEDLRLSLHEIGLELQQAESALYIPTYVKQNEPPQLLHALREQYPELSQIPWNREGIVLLGCPIGTDEYVHAHLQGIGDKIAQCSEQFSVVSDGLIHLQLHKFSVNAMLPYFLRTTNPSLTLPHAQRVDATVWKALLNYSEISEPDEDDPALHSIYEDARRQVGLWIAEGGFGITPNECVAVPAFYSAVSRALRFAAQCGYEPITTFLASEDFRSSPLCVQYLHARQDLITWGATEPMQHDGASQATGDSERHDGDGRKKPRPIILPALEDIIAHVRTAHLVFPEQKALTRLAQKANQRWSPEGLSAAGRVRTRHLSKQSITARMEGDETATYLQGIANFEEKQEIVHSPLSFLTHTESLHEGFSREVFAVLISYLLGLPAPQCLQRPDTARCEACNEPMDRFGHHRMSCKTTAAYHAAHAQLANAFAAIAHQSGVPFTEKGVPSHLTSQKVGDALCALSSDCRKLVLDYTVVHPRYGTPNAAGQWNHEALANAVRNKWNHHGRPYAIIGFAFAPCAITTYGRMHGHLLRLLYILAKKRAHMVHVHHRPLTHIDHLFGRFFAQGRARIGAAVARGMALRALGVSSLGVSKVFLKHVAPALYRDQTLSTGPHLSAGHTQWRLALSL